MSDKTQKPSKPSVAKASKPTPKEAEPGVREQRRAQKLKLLVKENPRREGTKAHTSYELYKKCKTVGEYLDAGGDAGYLNADIEAKRVSVS